MTRNRIERTGKRFCRRWTANEDAIVVEVYPDYGELRRRLPDRSTGALEARAEHLGVINRHAPRWTPSEHRRLAQMRESGATYREVCKAFPSRSRGALANYAKKHGFRLNRRYVASGDPALDAVKVEASRRGMSMADLDRQAGSGRRFRSGAQKMALKHVARAAAALGGQIDIEWEPLT